MARYSRLVLAAVFLYGGVSTATAQCCGDCDADGAVTISELVRAVTTALTECRPEPDPRIVLSELALTGFAATLRAPVREGRVALVLRPDWAADDDRFVFSISQPNQFSNRLELVKNGEFLRWIVAESSGAERDLSVRISYWRPGDEHSVRVTWGPAGATMTIDGVLAGPQALGEVLLPAGSDVLVGMDRRGSNYLGSAESIRAFAFAAGPSVQ